MSKDDGSLQLSGETTALMEIFLRRRSVRKYGATPATAEQVEYLLRCAQGFAERAGFAAPRLAVVERGEGFTQVVKGAMAGVLGKINPWLAFTKASHIVICGAVYSEQEEEAGVERALKEAAMTMQVALLAATEMGLGSCWMAGINHERVELALPMPDGARVVAISSLGEPPRKMGLSWDAMTFHLISKRRKPLDAIRMTERWRKGA